MSSKLHFFYKGKIAYGIFISLLIILVGTLGIYIINNVSSESYQFSNDGYAIFLTPSGDNTEVYPFADGARYSYRRFNDFVSYNSEGKNIKVPDDTIMHFADGSLLTLSKMVGIDATNIDSEIIFYYNLFKNTQLTKNGSSFYVNMPNGEQKTFDNLLIRLSENKFLLTGDSVRLVLSDNEIIDFGDYAYFEYTSGSIVKLYNNDKLYQTISSGAKLTSGMTSVNLADGTLLKSGKAYISLSNLVINQDGNINVANLEEVAEKKELSEVNLPPESGFSGPTSSVNSNGIVSNEEVVDESQIKQPTFKITEMDITALKVDAKIEITDDDNLLSSDTKISILENATAKTIYEEVANYGDVIIPVTCLELKPDTEYTLIASATWTVDGIDYNKNFISKIFRTESIGISLEKSYSSESKIVVNVTKEAYSNISELRVGIFNEAEIEIDHIPVSFDIYDEQEVVFGNLDPYTNYTVKAYEMLSDGVVVDDGYEQIIAVSTLRRAPVVGELQYEADKREATFNLSVSNVSDPDGGVFGYRYEIFDIYGNQIVAYAADGLIGPKVKVDDERIFRGTPYTYKLITEFYDGEKIVEYEKDLDSNMQLDGREFPNVYFDETEVTFEAIRGALIVEDSGNTITNDVFRVLYKNSLGSYTSIEIKADANGSGENLIYSIPISVNDLRANETYTFQVWGDVNLQDGNPTVDELYIGSTYVQTKSPKALMANFSKNDDYTSPFNLSFKLSSDDSEPLEAKTLSEMKFTVYEGSTLDGAQVVYQKVVDTNDDDYASTLKDEYFDNIVTITPKFFNRYNADFTGETYTIVVGEAKDYTSYKNDIPIENNIYTFTVSGYMPNPDDYDTENAINVVKILNKTATQFGLEYDESLDPNTIVGLNIVSKYIDTEQNALFVRYHAMMQDDTGKFTELADLVKDVEFDEKGNLPTTNLLVGKGTDDNVIDIDALRRGNVYYFWFEVFIDQDEDGITDFVWPNDMPGFEDLKLKSQTIAIEKQAPKFYMYPAYSEGDSVTWNYRYIDMDHIIDDAKLYSYVGPSDIASSSADIVESDNFQKVTFNHLQDGMYYDISVNERSIKSQPAQRVNLNRQRFVNPNNIFSVSYTVNPEVNKYIIKIDDDSLTTFSKATNVSVVIKPTDGGESKRITEVTYGADGEIIIDYYKIQEYRNREVEISIESDYDSEAVGYELDGGAKLLQVSSIEGDNPYYCMGQSGKLSLNQKVSGNCVFKDIELDPSNNKLIITNKDDQKVNVDITITKDGVVYNDKTVVAKLVKTNHYDPESNVAFENIVPSISMLDEKGKLNIQAYLDGAEFTANLYRYYSDNQIKNNKVYAELYETDRNGANAVYQKTFEYNFIPKLDKIAIEDLAPETNYYLKFYVEFKVGNDFVKQYLYDIDSHRVEDIYRFHTLSDIGISNVSLNLNASSYQNKNLELIYNIENLVGYDHIEYKVEEWNGANYVDSDVNFADSTVFFPTMSAKVSAQPGSGIKWGNRYRITITPVAYHEGKRIELGPVTKELQLPDYREVYVGVSGNKEFGAISFRVSINDPDHVVVGDKYSVDIIDLDDNNKLVYTLNDISTSTINKTFKFINDDKCHFEENHNYMFRVKGNFDNTNSGDSDFFDGWQKTKTLRFGESPDVGTVTANSGSSDNKSIELIFSGAYKIEDITQIKYTISNEVTGEFIDSKSEKFSVHYNSASGLYTYEILIDWSHAAQFKPGELYQISMNFYTDGTLIAQAEATYYNKENN